MQLNKMLSAFGFFTTEEEIQELFEQEVEEFVQELTYSGLDYYILKERIFIFDETKERIDQEYLVVEFEKEMENFDEISEELDDLAKEFDQTVRFTVLLMNKEQEESDPEPFENDKIAKLANLFDQLEANIEDDDNDDE
jgi:hypothetical protein